MGNRGCRYRPFHSRRDVRKSNGRKTSPFAKPSSRWWLGRLSSVEPGFLRRHIFARVSTPLEPPPSFLSVMTLIDKTSLIYKDLIQRGINYIWSQSKIWVSFVDLKDDDKLTKCMADKNGWQDSKHCADGGVYYLYRYNENGNLNGELSYPWGAEKMAGEPYGLNPFVSCFSISQVFHPLLTKFFSGLVAPPRYPTDPNTMEQAASHTTLLSLLAISAPFSKPSQKANLSPHSAASRASGTSLSATWVRTLIGTRTSHKMILKRHMENRLYLAAADRNVRKLQPSSRAHR